MCSVVSQTFVVCVLLAQKWQGWDKGLWRLITIQIIIIKESPGESSELILSQSRLGSWEKKGCQVVDKFYLPHCVFFSWPNASDNRAAWHIPAYGLSCLDHPGFLDHKMKSWLQDEAHCLPTTLFTEVEAGSQLHLTTGIMRPAHLNSYNSFADAQELAWQPQRAGAHLFYWSGVQVLSLWFRLLVEQDLGCL